MTMEGQKRKWRIADIGTWLKNAVLAMVKGEFLLRVNASKYFIHIIFTFFLFWVSIYLSMRIENTLTKVEENRRKLTDVEIYHAQKTIELVRAGRMSTIQQRLEDNGSALTIPQKPAERIK
jgi:hypothetical protein